MHAARSQTHTHRYARYCGLTAFPFVGQIKSLTVFSDARLHVFEVQSTRTCTRTCTRARARTQVSPSGDVGRSLYNETYDFNMANFVYNRNVEVFSGYLTSHHK
jgi:hypothetical protein